MVATRGRRFALFLFALGVLVTLLLVEHSTHLSNLLVSITPTNHRKPHPTPVTCRRKCPHHDNKIVLFFDPWREAGLNDRIYVLKNMANVAGFFCAKLYVPKPAFLLSKKHNGGQSLSSHLIWADFIELRFHDDHSLAVTDFGNPYKNYPYTFKRMKELMRDLTKKGEHVFHQIFTHGELDFIEGLRWVHNFTQFQVQKEWNASSELFVWGIHPTMYSYFDKMIEFFKKVQQEDPVPVSLPAIIVDEHAQTCPYVYRRSPPPKPKLDFFCSP